MKKLSILLAGVCLTAALYSVGTTYGQNKTNFAKQKEDTVTTNKYQGVNTRSNYTTYHSSYWSGTIYSYI